MAFASEFAEVLAELDEDDDLLPATITWNGNDYRCSGNGATRGGKLESYGWGVDEDLVIIVRAELFESDRPVKGQTLGYASGSQSGTFRIDHVLTAPGDAFMRLACVNASRGA